MPNILLINIDVFWRYIHILHWSCYDADALKHCVVRCYDIYIIKFMNLLVWIIKCWNVSDLQTLLERWGSAILVAYFGMNISGKFFIWSQYERNDDCKYWVFCIQNISSLSVPATVFCIRRRRLRELRQYNARLSCCIDPLLGSIRNLGLVRPESSTLLARWSLCQTPCAGSTSMHVEG